MCMGPPTCACACGPPTRIHVAAGPCSLPDLKRGIGGYQSQEEKTSLVSSSACLWTLPRRATSACSFTNDHFEKGSEGSEASICLNFMLRPAGRYKIIPISEVGARPGVISGVLGGPPTNLIKIITVSAPPRR